MTAPRPPGFRQRRRAERRHPAERRSSGSGTGRGTGSARHPWRLPLIFAAVTAAIVYAFDVDPAHACAMIAAAAILGMCNDIVEGLQTSALEPEKMRITDRGVTDLQFLAYSLDTGTRPIGERAYLRFRHLAAHRIELLGLSVDGDQGTGEDDRPGGGDGGIGADGGNRVHSGTLLHDFLTNPQRGKRMSREQLRRCLDQLDALLPQPAPQLPNNSPHPGENHRHTHAAQGKQPQV